MKAKESYFLVSQEAIERIDTLVSALGLAISEILQSRPVRDDGDERTELQQRYDELIMPHLYPDLERDPRQAEFEFD